MTMYCYGMPLLSPPASRDDTHALKHKMYQQKRKHMRRVRGEKRDGSGGNQQKKKKDLQSMRGIESQNSNKKSQTDLHSASCSRTLWRDVCVCWWTHVVTVSFRFHDTPSSALVFGLGRIFHCWQLSTVSSVECQYDIGHTLIWQQTQQGVRTGYDNWRSHMRPAARTHNSSCW